jgi:hypothetical protein
LQRRSNQGVRKAGGETRQDIWEKRRIAKIQKEKQKRMQSYRRYGSGKRKHSTMGVRSCLLAAGALAILGSTIAISFAMHGKAAAVIGGFGILAVVCAIRGLIAAIKGTRERDRNYITCKIGFGANVLLLAGLFIIFVGGF